MPKKKTPKRNVVLSVAMSADEDAALVKAADMLRLPKSVWARSVILREAGEVVASSGGGEKRR